MAVWIGRVTCRPLYKPLGSTVELQPLSAAGTAKNITKHQFKFPKPSLY